MTAEQKLAYARRNNRAIAPSTPVKVIPKVADSLKFKNPAYKAGAEELDEKMEEWRKSLNFEGGGGSTTVVTSGTTTPGGPGTKGDKGDPGPPGPNKFLCPDNNKYYSIVPRLGNDGITIGTQWVLYTGP